MSTRAAPPWVSLGRAAIADADLRCSLDARELALLSSRVTGKRRNEFIAGRLAGHAALAGLRERDPSLPVELVILKQSGPHRGRPRVVDAELRPVPVHVSITHCESLALALAARVPIGIDLVRIEEHSDAFVSEAFVADELDWWSAQLGLSRADPMVHAHAFAAKEALLKWLGTGFGTPLHAVASWPRAPLAREGEARGELYVRTSTGTRTLGFRRWFEAELLALALAC